MEIDDMSTETIKTYLDKREKNDKFNKFELVTKSCPDKNSTKIAIRYDGKEIGTVYGWTEKKPSGKQDELMELRTNGCGKFRVEERYDGDYNIFFEPNEE